MSRWRLVTRATFTPAPSSSSYRVTVGPTVMPTSCVSTPCDASDSCSVAPRRSISDMLTACWPACLSRLIGGNVQSPSWRPSIGSDPWLVPGLLVRLRRLASAAASPVDPYSASTSPAPSYRAGANGSPATALRGGSLQLSRRGFLGRPPSRSLLKVDRSESARLVYCPSG